MSNTMAQAQAEYSEVPTDENKPVRKPRSLRSFGFVGLTSGLAILICGCVVIALVLLLKALLPQGQKDAFPDWETVVLSPETAQKTGAFCLDGSPPGYYIRRGKASGKHKWMFHMQGGGWCVNLEECGERAAMNLGSSADFHTAAAKNEFLGWYDGGAQGILSSSCEKNPTFCTWNKVYIRYCDGASYAGDAKAPVTTQAGKKLYFRGQHVLAAILNDLLDVQGMRLGTELIAKGCSAGSFGLQLHLDRISSMVPRTLKVSGVLECGLFMDTQTHTGEDKWTLHWKHVAQMQSVSSIYNKKCLHHRKRDHSECFLPQYNLPYVTTRHFIISSVYDEFSMRFVLGLPASCFTEPACMKEHHDAADVLRESIISNVTKHTFRGSGFFLYNCVTHCWQLNRDDRWGRLSDGEMSLKEAFTTWYSGSTVRSLGAASKGPNSEPTCDRDKIMAETTPAPSALSW